MNAARSAMILGVILFLSFHLPCEAAASITVSPKDGSNNVRFGREDVTAGVSKEVRIRVNSSTGKQYQVFQRILDPFINERGEMLDAQVVRYNATIGSNSTGTLYGQGLDALAAVDQLLYSSNGNGDSDAFTIVYRIDRDRITSSGRYQGKLLLTVRSADGGSPSEVFLDIFIDVFSDYQVDVRSDRGDTFLRLTTDPVTGRSDATVEVTISGYVGPMLKVYQEVAAPFKAQTGAEIDLKAIQVYAVDSQGTGSGASPKK